MAFETYEDLLTYNQEGFELMENTANAFLLQFKEPIIYDLTIPGPNPLKRLINIYQDTFQGKIVKPSEVNNCFPWYDKRDIELDFENKDLSKVERGLEFCFNTKDKYDTMPLLVYLNKNPEVFGQEVISGKGTFYRFRNGVRDEIESNVKSYFNKEELKAFENIESFVRPYIENLDKPAVSAY